MKPINHTFTRKTGITITCLLLFILSNCKNESSESQLFSINGYIQKGPFITGSTITISELNENLSSSGKNFYTQTKGDNGNFELKTIEIDNPITSIMADGYFFNEVSGKLSDSRIVLSALVNLEEQTAINLNIMTTLEYERVRFLIENGESFKSAKKQAKEELLNIFGYSSASDSLAESLNIIQSGDENAMLLAISAIVLGTHTEAQLSELIAKISDDLKTDGQLNSPTLQSELINEAKYLDCEKIVSNLTLKYDELGETIRLNDFKKYVDTFIETTSFQITKKIEYPAAVNSRSNILSGQFTFIESSLQYSVAATIPKGMSLRVVIKPTPGYSFVGIGIFPGLNEGWNLISTVADNTIIEATGNGGTVTVPFMVGPPTSVDFFIYENGSTAPTQTITVNNMPEETVSNLKDTITINFQYGSDGPSSSYKNIYVCWIEASNYIQNLFVCEKLIKGGLTGTALPYWKMNKYPNSSSSEIDAVTSATIPNQDFTISAAIKDTSIKNLTVYFETDRSFDPNDWFSDQPALLYAADINLQSPNNEYELYPIAWTPNENTENAIDNTTAGVMETEIRYITHHKENGLFGDTDSDSATKMVKKITATLK